MTSELLARASYSIAKRRHLTWSSPPGDPVVVFSMAKTGSSAIAAALRATGRGPVHQVHDLDPEFLAHEEREYRWSGRPWRIWDAQRLLRTPATVDHPWTVVSLVRDPIAQTVSAFFQPGARRGYVHPGARVEDLLDRFGDRLDHLPLRWFDTHVLPSLGIDVFATAFDVEQGYQLIETPAVRLLLLRSEDLAAAPEALARLVGQDHPVPVPRVNVGADKSYAELYERFRRSLRPTPRHLDRAYRSQVVQHFYSAGEIARFRMVWGGDVTSEGDPPTVRGGGDR